MSRFDLFVVCLSVKNLPPHRDLPDAKACVKLLNSEGNDVSKVIIIETENTKSSIMQYKIAKFTMCKTQS
jgi:hypothetical protein